MGRQDVGDAHSDGVPTNDLPQSHARQRTASVVEKQAGSSRLQSRARFDDIVRDGTLRLAVTWYLSGSLVTGSNMKLKLHSMSDKLRLTERPAALMIGVALVSIGGLGFYFVQL